VAVGEAAILLSCGVYAGGKTRDVEYGSEKKHDGEQDETIQRRKMGLDRVGGEEVTLKGS